VGGIVCLLLCFRVGFGGMVGGGGGVLGLVFFCGLVALGVVFVGGWVWLGSGGGFVCGCCFLVGVFMLAGFVMVFC
jgi:hypothetical protein